MNASSLTQLRRDRLRSLLKSDEAIVIISSPIYFNNSRQLRELEFDSNIFYLTGYKRLESALFLSRDEEALFIEKPTAHQILFDGDFDDPLSAAKATGLTSCFYRDELKSFLQNRRHLRFLYDDGLHLSNDLFVKDLNLNVIGRAQTKIASLRRRKDAHEVKLLSQSAEISAKAHLHISQWIQEGLSEREIKIEFERALFLLGATSTAYSSIVAAGVNATTLHYTAYHSSLKTNEALLIDAAGKFAGYASDITRTYLGRNPSSELQTIYGIVKQVQSEIKALIKPGLTLKALHETAEQRLAEELLNKKIIHKLEEIKDLFCHGLSHWIGIDVHDPRESDHDYSRVILEEGMYFSVEPGLYFHPRLGEKYGKYSGIGVRIEDDLLVTATGAVSLTSMAPID